MTIKKGTVQLENMVGFALLASKIDWHLPIPMNSNDKNWPLGVVRGAL